MFIFRSPKTKETCFLNHYGGFRIIRNIHENKETSLSWSTVRKRMWDDWPGLVSVDALKNWTLFVLQWLINKFYYLYLFLSWARMLAQGDHWCEMKLDYLEKILMPKQVTIDALTNTFEFPKFHLYLISRTWHHDTSRCKWWLPFFREQLMDACVRDSDLFTRPQRKLALLQKNHQSVSHEVTSSIWKHKIIIIYIYI